MVYRPTLFALVVLFALDRMKISERRVSTIPTATNGRVGFASRSVNQLRPIEFFHFGVFRVHMSIMTKDGDFDNEKQKG
jgi:hypothetical protein